MRLLMDILLTVLRYLHCNGITFSVLTIAFQHPNILTFQEVIYGFDEKYSCWKIRFLFMNDIFIFENQKYIFLCHQYTVKLYTYSNRIICPLQELSSLFKVQHFIARVLQSPTVRSHSAVIASYHLL